MPIELTGDPTEDRRIKARAWVDNFVNNLPKTITPGAWTITIHDGGIDRRNNVWFVWVVVSASDGNGHFCVRERIEVVNPPLHIVTGFDQDGKRITQENPALAAREVLLNILPGLVK